MSPFDRNTPEKKRPPSRVPAVSKSWRIIDFIASNPDASISELAKSLGISKSTVSDIVRSLCDSSVLVRRANEPKFRLGPELIAVGIAAQRQMPDRRVVQEILKGLSLEHGCNVIMTQFIEPSLSYVIVESILSTADSSAFVAAVGAPLSFTSRAVGRAYLAGVPEEEADDLIRRWRERTDAVLDESSFLEPIATARRLGYAVNQSEYSGDYMGEINAVSVPLKDRNGKVVYILALVGYPKQLPSDRLPATGQALLAVAERLQPLLG